MVSTATLYRSPVRLVLYTGEAAEPYSSEVIRRARKRLMAEISLAGDEILIDDVGYSRNDASTLLDVVSEETWKAHTIIYNNKGLLHFLEKEEFNADELKKADAWLYNEKFVQSVSPYFAHSFNAVSGRLIKEADFEGLRKLNDYSGYILPEHSTEAWQKVRSYLADINYTLRNLSWEKFITDESVLHFAFSEDWKAWLNKLPSSFATVRDEIVENFINLVLNFQHKATWYYLHQLLVQLKQIETNDFNRSEVVRIDEIIYKNSRHEGKQISTNRRSASETGSGRIIWWGIWIVLMIVRAATCNNDRSSNYKFEDFKYTPPPGIERASRTTEVQNETLLLKFLDSLSRKPFLSIQGTNGNEPQTGSQPFSAFADGLSDLGPNTVILKNNTAHNCVMLYFDGPSKIGSVYQDAISHTTAVYIKKGDSLQFTLTPGQGEFYFVFGDRWGTLSQPAELPLYSSDGFSTDDQSRKHVLFVYEFFSNRKALKQKYLQRGIAVNYPTDTKEETKYKYLNAPAVYDLAVPVSLSLEEGKEFWVKASGGLMVTESLPDRK